MSGLELRSLVRAGLRALTVATSVCVVAALLAAPASAGGQTTGASSSMGQQHRAVRTLFARLNGVNEVPNGDPNGYGHVRVRLNPATNVVCARATWHRIGTPVAAHIHHGRRGVSGPVRVDLSGSVTGGRHCARGVGRLLILRIVRHPRRYYVNIHTGAFPDGAIRGQLHH